jgi:anthranilate phosphoribosyltransferase
MSSRCGSADLLEHLGVRLDLAPADVEEAIRSIGIGFLFAQRYHKAMAHVAPVRRDIGVRTIFNVLGPLTNPASAQVQVLGVFRPDLTETLAQVLGELGTREAFVVHGAGGLDEFSLAGPTTVAHLKDGRVSSFEVRPEEVGLTSTPLEAVRGGDVEENARIVCEVLEGRFGPARDIVVFNAAAAFVVGGLVPDLREGVKLAQEVIDSGRALEKMRALAAFRPAQETAAS